jgi:peptide/nickel transport system permease protein
MAVAVGFTALPEFVVGLILVMVFSTTFFKILPAVASFGNASPLSQPTELILPVATLALVSFPYVMRLARAAMIEALGSEYVAMARLKGMPWHIVVWRHAARNALVAPVQASAVILTYLLGGVVVVEYIFAYPGLGTALTQAVGARDLPAIQGIVLCIVTAVVIFNLVADALTILLTPKLRAPIT